MARKNNFRNKSKEFTEKEDFKKASRGRNRGGRNQGNRYGDKGQGSSSVPVYTGSSDNDPSWYVPNSQLIKDVASIPTVFRSGAPIILNPEKSESGTPAVFGNEYIPGIMTLYTMPMFGDGHDNYDALNTASNAFFIELRRATSGTSYYEDVDSMLYLLAAANILSAYAFVVRAYGLINYYRLENAYTPRALVRAMGIDYDDVSTHMADFRASLNKFAYRLQSIAIPKLTDYITRAVFMYENVYTDSESNKPQYYMYSPAGFYQYSEGGPSVETAAGGLKFRPLSNFVAGNTGPYPAIPTPGSLKHGDLINMLNNLLDPILESQDMGYIMADILKAMGTSNMYAISPIAETYTNAPVYNKEVLMQFENAHVYNYYYVSAGVKQNIQIGSSVLQPYFAGNEYSGVTSINSKKYINAVYQRPSLSQYFWDKRIPLNFHWNDVSPENIMVATRLSSSGSKLTDYTGYPINKADLGVTDDVQPIFLEPRTCGSDIAVGARISYYNSIANSGTQTAVTYDFGTKNFVLNMFPVGAADIEAGYEFEMMQALAGFDWHPRADFAGLIVGSTLPAFKQSQIWENGFYCDWTPNQFVPYARTQGVWDIDNYAVISEYELQRMHDIAIWGLFTSKLNVVQ